MSTYTKDKIVYSELLSSTFSSISIFVLSILSLLNNLSLDFYSMMCLLKVAFPAGVCFWILGHVIGKILDNYHTDIKVKKQTDDAKAYEIPSIFSSSSLDSGLDDDLGGIL